MLVMMDESAFVALPCSQDHKRVGEGDVGLNTGGMGAYSPTPSLTEALEAQVMETIIMPTVLGMAADGCPYTGVLYAGLMLTEKGPELLEYNVRFGDPECQVLMMRLRSDIVPALVAACDGMLENFDLRWTDDAALTVVLAANGYPGSYAKGTEIKNLDAAAQTGAMVFHAGTTAEGDTIRANGGRVLNVTAYAPSIGEAQSRAYAAVDAIDWPDGFCRRDIGWRAIGSES